MSSRSARGCRPSIRQPSSRTLVADLYPLHFVLPFMFSLWKRLNHAESEFSEHSMNRRIFPEFQVPREALLGFLGAIGMVAAVLLIWQLY